MSPRRLNFSALDGLSVADGPFHAEELAKLSQSGDMGETTFDQYRMYIITTLQRFESGQGVIFAKLNSLETSLKVMELAVSELKAVKERLDVLEKANTKNSIYITIASSVTGIVGAAFFAWLFRKL